MRIKEVHIVQVHAPERLVERCHQVLPRAPVAVRSWPHVVARLRRNEQFVAVGVEVVDHQPAHRLLCRAVGRSVVVGQVEVHHAVVEGIVCYLAATFVGVHASEVVPETEAHLGQQHAAAAASVECHCPLIVASGVSIVSFHHIINNSFNS